MNKFSITLFFAACVAMTSHGAIPSDIAEARLSLTKLEQKKNDYRPDAPKLTPEEISEYQRLTGFLYLEDPYWRLQNELKQQIDSLLTSRSSSSDPTKKLELLKEALAICVGVSEVSDFSSAEKDSNFIRNRVMFGDIKGIQDFYKTRIKAEQDAAANP